MLNGLEYILQRIEKNYYEHNRNLFNLTESNCLKNEGLDCNCITGIIVNCAAYVASICLDKDYKVASGMRKINSECYIVGFGGDKKLFPVLNAEIKSEKDFILADHVCSKAEGDQAYIGFRHYHSIDEIITITDYDRLLPKDRDRVEIWTRFLCAMRMQNIETCNLALWMMAAYLFPMETCRLIFRFKTSFEMQWLRRFMNEYHQFLDCIGGLTEVGFHNRFIQAYSRSTRIDISPIIGDLLQDDNIGLTVKSVRETLRDAYLDNISIIQQRRGFAKICSVVLKDNRLHDEFREIRRRISPKAG